MKVAGCCHSRRDAPSGTALSTSGTARCPCARRFTPRQVRCFEGRRYGTEFVPFLADIVVNQPRGKEIDVMADNFS
jgi:hypothetical protein